MVGYHSKRVVIESTLESAISHIVNQATYEAENVNDECPFTGVTADDRLMQSVCRS